MKNLKYAVSGIAVAFLVYIFTFYVDGEIGIILLAFVLFAPAVSMGLAAYARKNISVSFDCDAYVPKGGKLKVKVIVQKKNYIPLAVLELKPYLSEVFAQSNKVYKLSMLDELKKEFTFEVDAVTGGNGSIGVDSIFSCGFLGFIKLKVTEGIPDHISVGVIPEIPDIKASSQLIRDIANLVATSENDEDNDTAMMFTSNTVPGYEHREYIQGDPLKRINWKLSSKKSKLMVRLDEAASSVQPVLVLDLYRNKGADINEAIIREEKLICAVFGLVTALIKKGVACTFIYKNETGQAVSENIDNPEYPAQIMMKVLAVKINEGSRLSLNSYNESVCACIAATTDTVNDFASLNDKLQTFDSVCLLGYGSNMPNSTAFPLWYLDEDNSFKLV